MATFGAIASPAPNILFDAAKVDRDVQGFRRNQLLMENARQDQQYQTFDRDRQEVARTSAALLSLPPEQRPQAYAAAVQQLQARGFARQAPPQYPGDQQIEALARQGMTAEQQFSLVEKRRASEALMGALGLGGGMPAAPAAPITQASLSVPTPPAAGTPTEPRGIRNNNPLNLSFAGQPGAVMEEHATPRFARFETPEAGIAASVNQLRLYQQRGNNTLAGMINTWAPPSENNTGRYVQQVAAATGLRPDQPVNLDDPAVVSKLVAAMAQIETGRPFPQEVIDRAVRPVADATAATSAPPRAALPQIDPRNGLTREQAALAAAAASTNPGAVPAMVNQFRQQNQAAIERAGDNERAERRFQATQEQTQLANERLGRAEQARAEAEQRRAAADERRARLDEEEARRKADPVAASTEAERKAAGFLERMRGAEELLEGMVRGGYDPGNIRDRAAAATPFVGNFLSSEQGQQYMNAAAEWARAKLRLESGAVIGEAEAREEARTYFPMPGDSPATIEQKRRLRETAVAGIRTQAGRAAPRPSDATAAPAQQQEPGQRPPRASTPPAPFIEAVAAARARLGPGASDDDVVREAARAMGAR